MHLEQATAALAASDPDEPLLDIAGPIEGTRALVIGPGALPILCALIRRGAAAAEEMTLADRACPEPAELVIAPFITSLGDAQRALALTRRALLPCGRLVLRVSATAATAREVGDMLRAAGLNTRATLSTEAGVIHAGERPMFGGLE